MKIMEKRIFLVANIILPLFLGAAVYFFTSEDVVFVEMVSSFLGKPINNVCADPYSVVTRLVRYYIPDVIWAYALVFALYFSFGNNAARVKIVFVIAVIFSSIMEAIQLFPAIPGTFDLIDILVEAIAEIIAAFIIKIQYEEAVKICVKK
jgi:hypothetical protein